MTANVARMSVFSEARRSSGSTAMHSTTIAWACCSVAKRTMSFCSRRFAVGVGGRSMIFSFPDASMRTGIFPVVFTTTRSPFARRAAPMSRHVPVFPRLPST